MLPPTFAALLVLAPLTAPAQGPGAPAGGAPQEKVPPIQDDGDFYVLTFDENASQDALHLGHFVKLCQDATDYNFTYAADTSKQLEQTPLRMFGTKRIPKSDFFRFFQIMMIINDFVCTKVGPDHLAVWLIQSLQGQARTSVRNDAVYVVPEDLDQYADQPAVLINTVLDLPHTDVRTLSNSMRSMFTDANTQQIIPVGNSNSLIITGFGSNVAAIVKMLKFVDEASDTAVIVPEFEVIPLEFASAEEVSETLTDLLEASRRSAQARTQQQSQAGVTGALQSGQAEAKIMVDSRTNSLLIMAMPEDIPRIKELVARLDVEVIQGERTYHIYNLEHAAAEETAKTIEDFVKDASRIQAGAGARGGGAQGQPQAASSTQRNEIVVVPDVATNSLLIAANRSRYEELLELIKQLDVRADQVLIETALVELSGQDSFRLAVELGLAEFSGDPAEGPFGVSQFGLSTFEGDVGTDDFRRVPTQGLSGLTAGILSGDDFNLPILINALKTRSDSNVLNVPSVLVNNNKSARVTSKDEVPTATTTSNQVSNQTSFSNYVEAGITMEISPTISASHYLRLNISLEVSTFGAMSANLPPAKVTRTINTQVNVPDGDTMVVGGIITDNKNSSSSSVPWLSDIPVLGYLFGDNSTSQNKTTLYFFVTPHIMRDRDFADLAEYSFRQKMAAADTIGADRVRVVDPSFGAKKAGLDLRGFEVPLYRGPDRGEVPGESVGLDAKRVNELLKEEPRPPEEKP